MQGTPRVLIKDGITDIMTDHYAGTSTVPQVVVASVFGTNSLHMEPGAVTRSSGICVAV
jgi:hypothetical protein